MLIALYLGLLTLVLVYLGYVLWQIRNSLQAIFNRQEAQAQVPLLYNDLKEQVNELRSTMGGVANTLDAVGNQVSNLNVLAGHVLEEVDADAAYEEDESGGVRHIMIEIRPRGAEGSHLPMPSQPGAVSPEDLPPEMQDKFRTFQAVYRAIMGDPDLRSRQRPDLN